MTITEDQLASSLIKYWKESNKKEVHPDDIPPNLTISPEAHYNHYGDRGVADLYVEENYPSGTQWSTVYELKSESAVKNATGANEIIRQFNRMREYFFTGSSYSNPHELTFELCFTPTEYNINHICDNIELYHSSVEQKLTDVPLDSIFRNVTIRPPNYENITPIVFCNPSSCIIKDLEFDSYAKKANKEIYDQHKELFSKIEEEY